MNKGVRCVLLHIDRFLLINRYTMHNITDKYHNYIYMMTHRGEYWVHYIVYS